MVSLWQAEKEGDDEGPSKVKGNVARDQPAVDRIMGHAERANDMAAVYRQEAGDDTMDDRLRAVSEHVRTWLFPPKKATEPKPKRNVECK
jgi:hypothetical protein